MGSWAIVLNDKVIKSFTIEEGMILTVGRGSEADIVVDNTAISRKHSAIELRDAIYYISDLGSLNGTYVNGNKVTSPVPVSENDSIEIGKFRLIAAGKTEKGAKATSFAMPMDIEEETVFIASKQAAQLMSRNKLEKPTHSLTSVAGKALPEMISLDGKSSIKIGKDPSCDMIITGFLVAGAQCYIIRRGEQYLIVPQRGWASTFLNGIKIKTEHTLRKGDLIDIRSTKIRFE